jgi:hypothetical protein
MVVMYYQPAIFFTEFAVIHENLSHAHKTNELVSARFSHGGHMHVLFYVLHFLH